jgi:hypothetical protein
MSKLTRIIAVTFIATGLLVSSGCAKCNPRNEWIIDYVPAEKKPNYIDPNPLLPEKGIK